MSSISQPTRGSLNWPGRFVQAENEVYIFLGRDRERECTEVSVGLAKDYLSWANLSLTENKFDLKERQL